MNGTYRRVNEVAGHTLCVRPTSRDACGARFVAPFMQGRTMVRSDSRAPARPAASAATAWLILAVLLLFSIAAAVVILPLTGALSVTALIVLVLVAGLFQGIVPTTIFAAAVEAAGDERQGGAAMAVIMVGQNAGMLLRPIIFGLLVESAGWPAAFASLAVMSALGLLAGWLARVR